MSRKRAALFFSETEEKDLPRLSEVLEPNGGALLKKIGTLCISTFQNSEHAARAALDYRDSLEDPDQCRIAIAEGVVEFRGQDVAGETANLAAKIHGVCGPGSILAEGQAAKGLEETDIGLKPLGKQSVPGIAEDIEIFSVGPGSGAIDLTDLSFSDKVAEPPSPTTDAPSNDLFDFSRVEQERMQESATLQSSIRPSADEDQSLALEPDRSIDPIKLDAPEGKKKDIDLPKSWKMKAAQKRRLKITRKRWAWISLLSLGILIPLLMIGSWWGYFRSQEVAEAQKQAELQKNLKKSDVLRSLSERKKKKGPTNVRDIKPKAQGFGVLTIRSDPSGANVYINDQRVPGETPLRIKKVAAGINLKIKVTKNGFEETLQFTNIQPKEERKIKVKLVKK